MIPFLLLLAAAFCFLLILFSVHVAGISLLVLGFFLLALGLALSAYPGPRP